MELLKQGASASDAVARAITVLEDDPTTNAGKSLHRQVVHSLY